MDKIEKMQDFYGWLYDKVQNVHLITNDQFDNIIEKL